MKSFIPFKRLLPAAIVAAAAAASLVQVAQGGPPPPSVPGAIQVLDGSKVFLIGHAVGVQIYSCNGTAWSFVAPRANLFDDHGKLIITHFGGPTWQLNDGSQVTGKMAAKVDAPDPKGSSSGAKERCRSRPRPRRRSRSRSRYSVPGRCSSPNP